jgi:hypothetical protein
MPRGRIGRSHYTDEYPKAGTKRHRAGALKLG